MSRLIAEYNAIDGEGVLYNWRSDEECFW
jgi:hypothetical protein